MTKFWPRASWKRIGKLLVNKCSTGETKQKLFLACFVEQKKMSLLINKFFKLSLCPLCPLDLTM